MIFLSIPTIESIVITSYQDTTRYRAKDVKRAKAARDRHENRLLRSLLADPRLAQILGLRQSWTFRSLALLKTAINCVPGFCENVKSIVLANLVNIDNINSSRLTSAINTLAVCRRLTSLSLHSGYIDLDRIVICCPYLKRLYTSAWPINGSLNHISGLHRLVVDDCGSPDFLSVSSFLPVNSAATLTHLTMLYAASNADDFDINRLKALVNITHLWIEPICPSICTFLLNTNLKLIMFRSMMGWPNSPDIPELADTFAAPCFETVEDFGFHFYCWDAFGYPASEEYTPIVDVITSKLLSLRTIKATMPFHLTWCSQIH